MKKTEAKQWLIFLGGLVLAGLLVWFGSLLFSLSNRTVTDLQLFLLGAAAVLTSVFMLSNVKRYNLPIAGLFFGAGLYYFARSADIITSPLLTRLLGVVSFVSAAVLIYATFPRNRISEPTAPEKIAP